MKNRLSIWRARFPKPVSIIRDKMNCFRLVGRGLFLPEQGKRIFSRISDFALQMCGGGIVVPAENTISPSATVKRETAITGNRPPSDLRLISSVIQLDGDIVMRLHPEYLQTTPEQRKAALDHHFEDVLRALSPMQELRSLIITITVTFRTAVISFWSYFEIVPLLRIAGTGGNVWEALQHEIPLWAHLTSAVVLILSIAVPDLLRLIFYHVIQRKLRQETNFAWLADKDEFAEQGTAR